MINLLPYMNNLNNQLEHWWKLKISWWGFMAAIKMKILAVLLFLFQNLMVPISMKYIDKVQKMLNDFFWQNKGARIKMLHQKFVMGVLHFHVLESTIRLQDWWL